MNKFLRVAVFLMVSGPCFVSAQYQYQRLNHLNDIRYNSALYHTDTDFHTTVRPFNNWQIDSLQKNPEDSLRLGYKKWLGRKLFDENLVNVKGGNYHFTIDPVVNFRYGADLYTGNNPYVSTRGFLVEGKLGNNFSFYSSFLENQARFPQYVRDFTALHSVVPGQGKARPFRGGTLDFALPSGEISYKPNSIFGFTLGQGRNFFGEGYRSMILSDVAFNYPFFRIQTNFWKIKYVNLWAQMYDLQPVNPVGDPVYRKKYLSTHYLSLNITKRWNISLFESIIFGDTSQQRGIDASFFNPVILYRPVEFSVGSGTGNALLGFGTSYKVLPGMQAYAQISLDEFTSREFLAGNGYWANKYGYQVGVKHYNALGVQGLFYRLEYNAATPYTYSHRNSLSNYGHYGQPLAHPWGANFREALVHLVYQHKRWEYEARFHLGQIGLDTSSSNWGADIYRSYNTREQNYNNRIVQGEKGKLAYVLLRAAWVVNPASGLKIEAGIQWRDLRAASDTRPLPGGRSQYIFAGLRTEFFNRYYDF